MVDWNPFVPVRKRFKDLLTPPIVNDQMCIRKLGNISDVKRIIPAVSVRSNHIRNTDAMPHFQAKGVRGCVSTLVCHTHVMGVRLVRYHAKGAAVDLGIRFARKRVFNREPFVSIPSCTAQGQCLNDVFISKAKSTITRKYQIQLRHLWDKNVGRCLHLRFHKNPSPLGTPTDLRFQRIEWRYRFAPWTIRIPKEVILPSTVGVE